MNKVPIIYGTMDVAMEQGTAPELLQSIETNIMCRDYLVEKLEERKQPVLTLLIEKFGTDRVRILLLTSVQVAEQSEELTADNIKWAIGQNVPEEQWQDYLITDYVALDKLVKQFRNLEENSTTKPPPKPKRKLPLSQRLEEKKAEIQKKDKANSGEVE